MGAVESRLTYEIVGTNDNGWDCILYDYGEDGRLWHSSYGPWDTHEDALEFALANGAKPREPQEK